MERVPTVYILASQKRGTLYIGASSDPIARWWQHRSEAIESFTKRYGVKRLVRVEFFEDDSSDCARKATQALAS
jgi:putative endonuclease